MILFFWLYLAAMSPTPAPTLPPEIGNVYVRASCSQTLTALATALPPLTDNDAQVHSGQVSLVQIANTLRMPTSEQDRQESSNDIQQAVYGGAQGVRDNTTMQPARTLDLNKIQYAVAAMDKNIATAKRSVTALRALAQKTTDPKERQTLLNTAVSLEAQIAAQTALANDLSGYAETMMLADFYKGGETEKQFADAIKKLNLEEGRPPFPGAAAVQAFLLQQVMFQKFAELTKDNHLTSMDQEELSKNVLSDIDKQNQSLKGTESSVSVLIEKIQTVCRSGSH